MDMIPKVKANESWVNSRWRPMMGWVYMAICIFDFIIAPTLNYIFFGRTGADFVSWKPLTMSDGGMFHISMGAILGITAWTRGKEKLRRYEPEDEEYYEDRASYRDRISNNSPRED